jgi:inosine-uridine nucleoside N-ribohydrolase
MISDIKPYGPVLNRIMRAAEHLDIANFGEGGAYIHDENTVAWLKNPSWYETLPARLSVVTDQSDERAGHLVVEDLNDAASPVRLVVNNRDPSAVFGFIAESIAKLFSGSLSKTA